MHRPETMMMQCTEWDFDNFKFIVHELFLYAIAAFIKYECFDAISYLLRNRYFFSKVGGTSKMISFAGIRQHAKSFEYRNQRLKLNRTSVRADILANRAVSGLSFGMIPQADFILFIRDCFESLKNNQSQSWWPEVRVYLDEYGGALEIFARAESNEYFQKIKGMLGITSKKDFDDLVTTIEQGKIRVPEFGGYGRTDITYILGYDKLATRP